MKSGVLGFLLGVVAAAALFTVVFKSHRERSMDFTATWSSDMKSFAGDTWLKNAQGWRHGALRVFTPDDPSNASMQIQMDGGIGLPGIAIQDDDTNGVPDSVIVADKSMKSITVSLKNGAFADIQYSTGISTSSVTYIDSNCDGIDEMAIGPGRTVRVQISGQWHDLIHTNHQTVIREGSGLRLVKRVAGEWKIQ